LGLLVLVPALAHADGALVFQRGTALWQKGDVGETKLADLEDNREVRWIEATREGKLVVLDLGGHAEWLLVDDPPQTSTLYVSGCTGRAHPAPTADVLVCPTADGPTLVAAVQPDISMALPDPLDDAAFLGTSPVEVVGLTADGVVALDRRRPTERRTLTRPGATSHFLAAPDGVHAVAVFGEKMDARVRTFLLDGQGVSRQLGGPGVPTLFSWDSQWLMFQEGDIANAPKPGDEEGLLQPTDRRDPFLVAAPKAAARKKASPAHESVTTRACVARATGGEVKCWDGYTGMAFSPDSTRVLLKRDKVLYVGKIAGVRPDAPVKVIDNADGAATWVPVPLVPARPATAPPAPAQKP
jgi:hypothetical protein